MSDPKTVHEAHQLRDCVVRCREGDATGYGIFESMVIGAHPRYGLTRETSFLWAGVARAAGCFNLALSGCKYQTFSHVISHENGPISGNCGSSWTFPPKK
jgi:hypothetical protein